MMTSTCGGMIPWLGGNDEIFVGERQGRYLGQAATMNISSEDVDDECFVRDGRDNTFVRAATV